MCNDLAGHRLAWLNGWVVRRIVVAVVGLTLAASLAACAQQTAEPAADQSRPPWPHDSLQLLPPPDALEGALLVDAMMRRGSVRDFTPEPLSLPQVSALLWSAQGVSAPSGGRTVPSAGALYPLEVYVVTDDAVLHYLPDTNTVEVQNTTEATAQVAEAVNNVPASLAPAIVIITGVPSRVTGKYVERGIRYMWMEAGHAAQNLLLAAAALGLGAVTIGAYNDGLISEALGLSDAEQPLYLIPIGNVAS